MLGQQQLGNLFDQEEGAIYVEDGWSIVPTNKTTAENQLLRFDVPGARSKYHGGQQSDWLINAIEKTAAYLDGDPDRTPTRSTINKASDMLIDLTNAGKLFPEPLEKVRYRCAWSKGADAAFNGLPLVSNSYAPGSKEFAAWREGWHDV